MSTNRRLFHRARNRAQALLISHSTALAQLERLSPSEPVVPTATHAQQQLEAAVVLAFRILKVDREDASTLKVLRITPRRSSLELEITGANFWLISRLTSLFCSWSPDLRSEDGYPGIRYRPLTNGVGIEFYVLGEEGSVRIKGIDPDEFAFACSERAAGGNALLGTEPTVHQSEINSRFSMMESTGMITSLFIRRAGILLGDWSSSVDIWPGFHSKLCVEVFTRDRSKETFDKVIATLTSSEFSPRLTVLGPKEHLSYSTLLQVKGSREQIDLRIQTAR